MTRLDREMFSIMPRSDKRSIKEIQDEEDRIAELEARQEARAWRERLYDLEGE